MNIICALFNHKWRFLYKSGTYCYYICTRCGKESCTKRITFKGDKI